MEVKFNDLTKKFGNFTAVDHLTMTMTNGVYGLLGVKRSGKNNDDANALYIAETYKRKYYL